MRKESITQAELKELLDYDPETGIFRWKICRGGKQAGRVAGCKHRQGYVYMEINSKHQAAHRLAWVYVYGVIPDGVTIDHINGVRDDNRIENLRLATKAQQMQNKQTYKNSTTKTPGVNFHKASGKFAARVTINGVDHWIGVFDTLEEAAEARRKKKAELHLFQPIQRGVENARD